MLERPTIIKTKWLTAETSAKVGLSQKEVDRRAANLELVLKDILNKLYNDHLNKKSAKKADASADVEFIWQRAIQQANQLHFQLPKSTQQLAQQVCITALTCTRQLGSNLLEAALANLQCQVEIDA